MPRVAFADHPAGRDVQRDEQRTRVAGNRTSGIPAGPAGCGPRLRSAPSRRHTAPRLTPGGAYSPTMSLTFATTCGSLNDLNVSCRCGLSAKACQMRAAVSGLKPHLAAIERVLRCVVVRGSDSSVSTTTRLTSSSPIWQGAPGRGSSSRSSKPLPRKRLRHLPTVALMAPSPAATEFSESHCSKDRGGTSRNALDLAFSVQRLSENSVRPCHCDRLRYLARSGPGGPRPAMSWIGAPSARVRYCPLKRGRELGGCGGLPFTILRQADGGTPYIYWSRTYETGH